MIIKWVYFSDNLEIPVDTEDYPDSSEDSESSITSVVPKYSVESYSVNRVSTGVIGIIIAIITVSRFIVLLILSEVLLIVVILKVLKHKNVIIFYLLNLMSRFFIFLRLFIENYNILLLGNLIKLGLFPFTYIIMIFYYCLTTIDFITISFIKLPYLAIMSIKFRILLLLITIIYLLYNMYSTNNTIIILTIYSILSTIIMLSMGVKMIYTYYLMSNSSIIICLMRDFSVISMYNLMRLPLRLTFYIKILFLIRLNLTYLIIVIIILTLILLYIIKFITNNISYFKMNLRVILLNVIMI